MTEIYIRDGATYNGNIGLASGQTHQIGEQLNSGSGDRRRRFFCLVRMPRFFCWCPGAEVEGQVTQGSQIGGGVAGAHAALVLSQGGIEHPVQGVF